MRMKTINKKAITAFVLTVSLALMLTACGTSSQPPAGAGAGTSGTVSGTVTVSGSTSVQPLAQDLADIFNETEPGVSIEIQGGGSSQGIKDVTGGISNIGTSSRDLTADEKTGLTEHVIAYDGIAIVVHPSNPVSNLSTEQVQKIFKGEIKNWKEVGGKDSDILVVTREEGSGTRTAFEELLKLQEKKDGKTTSFIRSDALVGDGTGAIKANVASKENAIGFTSLGFVDSSLKKVNLDTIECSIENVKEKTYAISRPFLMLTKGAVKPETKAFLDFILSDKGQEIVGKSYITIK
jgi:phosphate transport system substrate-binding protein